MGYSKYTIWSKVCVQLTITPTIYEVVGYAILKPWALIWSLPLVIKASTFYKALECLWEFLPIQSKEVCAGHGSSSMPNSTNHVFMD